MSQRRDLARADASDGYLEKKTALIAAAAEQFRAQGFDRVSLESVARAAGMARASVYYYYSNKEELFGDLVLNVVTQLTDEVENISERTEDPLEAIWLMVHRLAAAYDTHYPYLHIFAQEDLRQRPAEDQVRGQLAQLTHRYSEACTRTISRGIETGQIRTSANPRVLAFSIIGTVNWMSRWYVPGGPYEAGDVANTLANFCVQGLVADGHSAAPGAVGAGPA